MTIHTDIHFGVSLFAEAFPLYFGWLLFQGLAYTFLPGKIGYGQTTPAGHTLPYIVSPILTNWQFERHGKLSVAYPSCCVIGERSSRMDRDPRPLHRWLTGSRALSSVYH